MDDKPRKFSFFPKTLAQCIEPLTRPVFKSQGLAGTRLITEWPKVVGPQLASRSVPQKLSFPPGKTTGGTLTISVENGFATELQHMQPIILERLATYFGYRAVERISISHSHFPIASKPVKQNKTKSIPVDMGITEQVGDDELKEALKSFGKTLSGGGK